MTVDCSIVLCYPVELFIAFIAIPVFMALFGFLRQPQIPAMLAFGGIFVLFLAVTTYGIIVSYSAVVNTPQSIIYNVLTNTNTANLNADTPIRAEYPVNSASALIGDTFDCINIPLQKVNNPPLGTLVTVGVFANDMTLVKSFGTMNVTSMSTGFFFYDVCLPEGETYTIGQLPITNQRIGAMYNDGDSTNRILVRSDNTDPFDSTNSVLTTWVTASGAFVDTSGSDISASIYLRGADGSDSPNVYEFTEIPKIFLALIGIIMMLCGALMVGRN